MRFLPYGCTNGRCDFAPALRSVSDTYAFALTGRCNGDGRHNPGCRFASPLLRICRSACPGLCAFAPSGRFVVADCAKGFRLAEIKRSVAPPLSPPNFQFVVEDNPPSAMLTPPLHKGGDAAKIGPSGPCRINRCYACFCEAAHRQGRCYAFFAKRAVYLP